MKHIKQFQEFVNEDSKDRIESEANDTFEAHQNVDFVKMQADLVGMTREEWIAHYATPHPEEE